VTVGELGAARGECRLTRERRHSRFAVGDDEQWLIHAERIAADSTRHDAFHIQDYRPCRRLP
jgi:hypothetical protein